MKRSDHTVSCSTRLRRVGIFDHESLRLGGSQLVVANMAAQLSQHYAVDVIHSGQGYTLGSLAKAFGLDLARVNERIVSGSLGSFSPPGLRMGYLRRSLQLDRELTEPYDLFIYSGHRVPPFCSAKRGLVYCHFPFESHPDYDLPRTDRWESRGRLDRWIRLRGYTWLWNRRMRGYQTVLGNSNFTSGWIERRWERPSEVLYPPVAIEPASVVKENIIVSLGRFIVTDGKNHALQLKAFREFLSTTGGNWRLCLIGFCTDLPQDREYLEMLKTDSKDIPVTFVVNASREALWAYLASAKLYWHATALGDESNVPPERREHFGIATAEAMGAGCVPLVPMSGGQPEIVEHEVSGFLCRDAQALLQYTSRLAGDESLCRQMGQAAKERSSLFCPETFNQRLSQLVTETLCQSRTKVQSRSEHSRPSFAHDR
ncbi:MAG: glycosyltransferase [Nitrospirae bacterium]|nr:glycosyltransferase [Nitrospirota bacterium]MDE3042954.1 glycosyltransferase [Nitrospirota bacterium]MDE3219310.1 glycosyltransferase [Nitrospirota bacterium]